MTRWAETTSADGSSSSAPLSANRVRHLELRAESTVLASNSPAQHCTRQHDTLLRWGLVSRHTRVPQRRHYFNASSEQSNSHAAEDVRDGGLQQRFWAASMVLTTALPARLVGSLELREYSFISHSDICRSLKPCPQAKLRSRSSGEASNSSQWPCQSYKEARLRWGLASFFTGAPRGARPFVPVCVR